jgi:predicted RNA-binding Zn-ribbon protein involved in translation (DUF1610 family)
MSKKWRFYCPQCKKDINGASSECQQSIIRHIKFKHIKDYNIREKRTWLFYCPLCKKNIEGASADYEQSIIRHIEYKHKKDYNIRKLV